MSLVHKKPALTHILCAYQLTAHAYAAIVLWGLHRDNDILFPVFVVFIAISMLLTVFEYLAANPAAFRWSILLHGGILFLGQYFLTGNLFAEITLISGFIAALAIYEESPLNFIIATGFAVLCGGIRFLILAPNMHSGPTGETAGLIAFYVLTALITSFITYYREKLIETQMYGHRLEQAISKLSRSNQEYQDYLITIESESTERERKRITRDIHDIVGYTLTNNIMLMEAATDMARSNPIGLSKLLNTARENAQEGLQQIRESLYSFRKEKIFVPYGLHAISKLVETFQLSTDIRVDISFGNMPWTVNADIDSAIYHMIQESMINVLRHSTADTITIQMGISDRMYEIDIRDNGVSKDIGTQKIIEGIGLKGMIERLQKVGGELTYGKVLDGFLVRAMVPIQQQPDTPQNPQKQEPHHDH